MLAWVLPLLHSFLFDCTALYHNPDHKINFTTDNKFFFFECTRWSEKFEWIFSPYRTFDFLNPKNRTFLDPELISKETFFANWIYYYYFFSWFLMLHNLAHHDCVPSSSFYYHEPMFFFFFSWYYFLFWCWFLKSYGFHNYYYSFLPLPL